MVYLVIATVFLLIAGLVLFFILSKNNESAIGVNESGEKNNPIINFEKVMWQDIQKHLRLNELLNLEGVSFGNVKVRLIFNLTVGAQFHLIYAEVGDQILRARVGELGIATITPQKGIRFGDLENQMTITEIVITSELPSVSNLLCGKGVQIVAAYKNSLIEGASINFCSKGISLNIEFIKEWDVPTGQSDTALKSKISSISDISYLTQHVRDVQNAVNLNDAVAIGKMGVSNLPNGVCYILGLEEGRTISFNFSSDVSILFVDRFESSVRLVDFFDRIKVLSQMHARLIRNRGEICVASQDETGEYSLIKLVEQNVILGIKMNASESINVVRIEQGVSDKNRVTIDYLPSNIYKNVLIWSLE